MTLREIISGAFRQLGRGIADLSKGDLNGFKRIFDSLAGIGALIVVTGPLWIVLYFIVDRPN